MTSSVSAASADASARRSAPGLSLLLQHTADAVRAVLQGRSLAEGLPEVPAALRPGVQALTFHALRHLGLARALVSHLADRSPEPAVQALLIVAVGLLVAPADGVRYAPHTVVNQAVEAARQHRRLQRQAGFINACLRRLLREQTDLMADVAHDPQARHHHPAWWVERVRRDHPQDWESVLQASQQSGPMTLRVNRRRIDRSAYARRLSEAGMASLPTGDDGLVLAQPCAVEGLPGWSEGLVSVQDAAAQMAAGLLLDGQDWGPQHRVLDACAAPGGKTAHLLERADAQVLALDADAARARRIDDTLQRLGLQDRAEVKVADAADTVAWWDGRPFDAILLDAPCTASGIVRRHPDVRWLRRESDVAALAVQQRRLLDALWPLLKPGGRLLYATCSVFRAEGEDQMQAFVARHTDARRQPSAGHLLPGAGRPAGQFNDNPPGGHDGFFYARLDKPAA